MTVIEGRPSARSPQFGRAGAKSGAGAERARVVDDRSVTP